MTSRRACLRCGKPSGAHSLCHGCRTTRSMGRAFGGNVPRSSAIALARTELMKLSRAEVEMLIEALDAKYASTHDNDYRVLVSKLHDVRRRLGEQR